MLEGGFAMKSLLRWSSTFDLGQDGRYYFQAGSVCTPGLASLFAFAASANHIVQVFGGSRTRLGCHWMKFILEEACLNVSQLAHTPR